MSAPPARTYEIHVESSESVVPGGVRRVTWLAWREGDWSLASELPEARVEQADRGPGMVWLRRIALRLPVGARLARVESAPRRAAPRDPLAYLLGPRAETGREARRSYFEVGPGGKLVRLPPPGARRPG